MVPLGVYRLTHALREGGAVGRGLGNFHVWLTQYVQLCMVEVKGNSILKKSIQCHYLAFKHGSKLNPFCFKQAQN